MKPLNDYSQRFASILFQAFPEWEAFSTVEVENEQEKGYLQVKVPAPVSGLLPSEFIEHHDDFLFIDTDGEVTVSYDYYHCHFDRYSDIPEEQGFREAIEFILALVKEEICIVVVMNRGQWCGSTSFKAGEEPDLSWAKAYTTVYIRSWQGTYNRIDTAL